MNTKRTFFGMVSLVGILSFGLFGASLAAQQLLTKQSHKLVTLKLDNRLLEEQQTALTRANKDITKYADLETIAKTVVPQDKDQAAAVREIVKIGNDSGVKLSAINFSASTLGQGSVKSADGSPAVKSSPLTQAKPVDGIPGVYVMEITIQQDGNSPVSYQKLIDFLSRLEQNRRTAQVTSVNVTPNPQDRNKLTFNLVVNVYIKP